MIAIAIDDSACLAVGAKGTTHALSADVIWTGHGWIIADMRDAGALLEANRWAPFGKVVGLCEAMKADDDFRLHYLAALFKRAADALGEPLTGDLAIAVPSAAVRWMRSAEPADAESCLYFQPNHEDVLKDFQRAAQIAGFKRVCVRPAALCLFERFPGRETFARRLQNRAAVVEVFRTGFSLVPVGAESLDSPWSAHGRQLWIDHDVEAWAVDKTQQAVGEKLEDDGISHKIRAAIAGGRPVLINGAQNGRAEEHELAPSVLAADTSYVPNLAGIPDPASLAQLLRHPVHDTAFDPRYLAILVSGWLSGIPLVKGTLEGFLQNSLRGADSAPPPPVWDSGMLRGAAEGARRLAEREGSWLTSGSAEVLDLTRGPSPPEKLADAKATGEKHVHIDGAKRPAIGRLSWLVDAADRVAVATLQGGGTKRHYRIEYQLQRWESRARVEAEVTIEQDDRVLLSTLVDGRPAPALVVPLTEKGREPEPINAIAPGRFQLYLNDEHRLLTQASLEFKNGPRGTVARFAPAPETR